MPLSDEEARLLQQLEQSLAAEDPDFASTLRGSAFAARNRRVAVLAGVGFLLGIGLLFGGAVAALTWLGVIGFLLMLIGAYFFVTAWTRGVSAPDEASRPSAPRPGKGKGKSSGSFVDRMEERWQRRQDGDQF